MFIRFFFIWFDLIFFVFFVSLFFSAQIVSFYVYNRVHQYCYILSCTAVYGFHLFIYLQRFCSLLFVCLCIAFDKVTKHGLTFVCVCLFLFLGFKSILTKLKIPNDWMSKWKGIYHTQYLWGKKCSNTAGYMEQCVPVQTCIHCTYI